MSGIEAIHEWLWRPGSALPLALFRIAFGTACAIKVVREAAVGSVRWFHPHTYLYASHRARFPRWWIRPGFYRLTYAAKMAGTGMAICGVLPRVAFALLAVGFAVEWKIYPANHTALFSLLAGILAVSPSSMAALSLPALVGFEGDTDRWLVDAMTRPSEGVAPGLVMFTITLVYVATAIRKLNEDFLSGLAVHAALNFTRGQRTLRGGFDGWYPRWFEKAFLEGDDAVLATRWRPLMMAVVSIELALPVLLLTHGLTTSGVVLGIMMHGVFTWMYPTRLFAFTLVSVSTYVFFVPCESVEAFMRTLLR